MGAIEKSEREYKNAVVRLVGDMRETGQLPWHSITDGTRLRRKPDSFSDLNDALRYTQRLFRRALWADQPCYVEVWAEKDAVTGVVFDVTAEFDVPLMICRGYPSRTYLHDAARAILYQRKPAWLYYLGDHDPSGVDIERNVEAKLREYAPAAEVHFQRLAVTPAQIDAMGLPTRPTKKTDSRSKRFKGESVEVDAIPPHRLRSLVREAIERHIDPAILERTRRVEAVERESLDELVRWAS